MHNRPNNRSANHKQQTYHQNPTSLNTSKQKQPLTTSFSLNTASNNQLKKIIQKLIIKSRSLITSLQSTLKELQQVRLEKDFWKGHYFEFRTACERCINSKGIAPFQYISELERTVREWTFRKEEEGLVGGQLGKIKMMSLANSRMRVDFRANYDGLSNQKDLQKQLLMSDNKMESKNQWISTSKQQQHMQNTQAKTPTKPNPIDSNQQIPITTPLPNPQPIPKTTIETSFTGIRLGHTNSKKKNSPTQNNINTNNFSKGLDKTFKRKDSIETKRIEIFSFAHQKNISKNLNKTLEMGR